MSEPNRGSGSQARTDQLLPASAGAPPGTCDVGLVGLGVMGQNLALNLADHGFRVAVFNRTWAVTEEFLRRHTELAWPGGRGVLVPAHHPPELVSLLRSPRIALMMVQAGAATEAVIESLVPHLAPGDILVDGGNAHWEDTIRRERTLRERGVLFVGCGVSGGEVGARWGPSLMVGGSEAAWERLGPMLTAIAAKVDARTGRPVRAARPGRPGDAPDVEPCAARVGPDGAGHYVKMVHNGIEYADMQLIGEAYQVLRDGLGLGADAIADVFARWNEGELESYLVEITAEILRQRDPVTGRPIVDVILDVAGQKGTGQWTATSALELGVPAGAMAEAVFARFISARKDDRELAARVLTGPAARGGEDGQGKHETRPPLRDLERSAVIHAVGHALLASKICAYVQGFSLLAAAGRRYNWPLDFGTIAAIWRGGCIIRARLLHQIRQAYSRRPDLPSLALDEHIARVLTQAQGGWRQTVAWAVQAGIPVPAMASCLAWYDSLRCERLAANLLQAQRDYFGSHTYERIDQPRGRFFHLEWSEPGRPQKAV